MGNFKFGDIVLLKFPFTDGKSFKKRPALVIRDFDDGDILVCRITSQITQSPFDVEIAGWENAGLRLPSVVRVHKMATLEKSIVNLQMGQISSELQTEIKRKFELLPA